MTLKKGICVHLTYKGESVCIAGVSYAEVTAASTNKKQPCVRCRDKIIYTADGEKVVRQVKVEHGQCELFQEPTEEMLENSSQIEDRRKLAFDELRSKLNELKVEYLANPTAGDQFYSVQCPYCRDTIKVRYRQFTGKMMARCQTPDCLQVSM